MRFKIALLLLVTISLSAVTNAQDAKKHSKEINKADVVYLEDTVFSKGKPYFLMKEIKINQYHPDYSVRNINGEELMYIKYNTLATGLGMGSYHLNFPSGNYLKLKTSEEKNIPNIIANRNLISNGQISKDAEEKFILSNGGILINSSTDNKFTLINRNTHAEIIIITNNIKQDLVTIGNIKEGEPFYLNKILYHQLSYFLPGGQKVAEAVFAANSTDGQECKITTVKDQQTFNINLDRSKGEKKQIAEFLVNKGYL